MKKIVFPLIAVAAVAAIAPKFVGSQVDTALNDFVAHVNTMPGYTAKLSQIETSWFATTAQVNVALDVAGYSDAQSSENSEAPSIMIDFDASHGPILFGHHSGLGWAGWSAKINAEDFREQLTWAAETPLYQLSSIMGLLGDHSFSDMIPEISMVADDSAMLKVSAYNGQGTYDSAGLAYSGQSESMTAEIPQYSIAIEGLAVDLNMKATFAEMNEQGIYDGDTKVNLGSVAISSPEGEALVSLVNAYITTISDINDKKTLGSLAMFYGADSIESSSFKGQDVGLDLEFSHLSASVFKEWQSFSKEIETSVPETLALDMEEFMQVNLLTLLLEQPQINLTSLRATLPEGKVSSHLNTTLVGIDALPDDLQDIGFWISHAQMDGKIEGDKAAVEFVASQLMKVQMLEGQNEDELSQEERDQLNQAASQQTQGMLGMLTQQGMVKATDTHYVSELLFEDSQFKVNGNVIPLPIPGAQ